MKKPKVKVQKGVCSNALNRFKEMCFNRSINYRISGPMEIDSSLICVCNGKLYSDRCCLNRHCETDIHKNNMLKKLSSENIYLKSELSHVISLLSILHGRIECLENKLNKAV